MLFRQIEYFQAVVETSSFYEAAERCHVSQSAVSQQIKKLEAALGVRLLDRHNRTFTLTSAGEVFYRRSLVLRADIEQLIRETQRAGQKEHPELRLGCYQGYQGQAFALAIAQLSERHPALSITTTTASHEDIFRSMRTDAIDLVLNDQRRAFSDAYHNVVLAKCEIAIELSAQSPLAKLDALTAKDLSNLPCILVAHGAQQAEEQAYCTDVLGLHSEFRFARTFEEARLMVLTAQGYLPVDTFEDSFAPATAIERVPLVQDGQPVTKNYCAFWKTSNRNPYAEEFAQMLQAAFSPTQADEP